MANIINTKYYDNFKSFYINRFIRIISTYYLAVALTIFIDCDRLQLSDFYSIIFCYYNYSQSNISNPVLWSISTEIQFYLIAPLIAIAARSLPTLPIIIGAIVLAIKLYYFNNHGSASAYMGLEVNLLYFMVGWCAYSFRHALPKLTPALGLSIMTMTLFLMWRYHWEYINPIDTSWDRLYASVEWMLIFPAILCVAGLLVLPGLDRKATNNGGKGSLTLQFLGVTSYMVYVIHDIAGTWFGPNIFIKFILVYWLAYTLHLIYEFPLYQLRRPVKEVL